MALITNLEWTKELKQYHMQHEAKVRDMCRNGMSVLQATIELYEREKREIFQNGTQVTLFGFVRV